ncbi:MAG TPA: OmpH family outer membrane protein [Trueperaceae bacterium]|jgi:Skp family chaperone for outer membrane proteins|nr:OmpH family outer membrane protein [Trueperaceae bacterium]
MKRLTVIGIALVLALVLAFTNLSAQGRPTKVVFVRAQAAILAHPAGAQVEELRQQAQAEIGELLTSIQALESRIAAGEELSPEDNERYQALVTSANAVQERYRQEIDAAAQPAIQAVNGILAELAAENGYTLIMDADKARELDLVVYADDDLDVTQLVVDRLNAQ